MLDHGLLTPGAYRAAAVADDGALVDAMIRTELAWLRALSSCGVLKSDDVEQASIALTSWRPELDGLARDAEAAGNVVVPLVKLLRTRLADQPTAELLHRGLTSQDVLDTALMLVAARVLAQISSDLEATSTQLGVLARRYRDQVMVGRTLTQYAVPVTFGLKAARWLSGVLDAWDRVVDVRSELPVQCGGAAGTLALAGELMADPLAAARSFAGVLDLSWPGAPWHTVRSPVTTLGDCLVQTCDALGVIAADIAHLARPEVDEVQEGVVEGRGASSTMPHKQNPVLTLLVRSAAMQAPLLGAQLHHAAASYADERPDGAWQSEWPALKRLLVLTATAASQMRELLAGLRVNATRMQLRAEEQKHLLLAEKFGASEAVPADAGPASYVGSAGAFVDVVLERLEGRKHG